jgi:hypothetical protein
MLQGKEQKPSAWTITACSEWLSKDKIPSNDEFQDELWFIKLELIKYQTHITTMILLEKQQSESVNAMRSNSAYVSCDKYDYYISLGMMNRRCSLNNRHMQTTRMY